MKYIALLIILFAVSYDSEANSFKDKEVLEAVYTICEERIEDEATQEKGREYINIENITEEDLKEVMFIDCIRYTYKEINNRYIDFLVNEKYKEAI